MSPLAQKLYRVLRKRVTTRTPSITYRELAAAAGDFHPRAPSFHAALGEVTHACRRAGVPVLPAIVWKVGAHRPSTGYYKVAHPRAHTDDARRAAWEREYARVLEARATFPAALEKA